MNINTIKQTNSKRVYLSVILFLFVCFNLGMVSGSPTVTNYAYADIGEIKATITQGINYNENGYYDFYGLSGTMNLDSSVGDFNYSGSNFTVSLFANATDVSGTEDLVSKYSNTPKGWIFRAVSGTLKLSMYNSTGDSQSITVDSGILNQLRHYAFTVGSDGNVTLYIDGEIKNSSIISNQFNDGKTADFQIGSRSSEFWNGTIDEVRIYNKTLSNADMIVLNNTGVMKNVSLLNDSLIEYFSFDDAGEIQISGTGVLNLTYLNASVYDKIKFDKLSSNEYYAKAKINITSQNVDFFMDGEILKLFSGDYISALLSSEFGLINITNSTIISWDGSAVDETYGDFDTDTEHRPYVYFSQSSRNPSYLIDSNFSYLDHIEIKNADDSLVDKSLFSYSTIGLTLRTCHRSSFVNNIMHDIHTNITAPDGQNLTKGIQYLSSKNGTIENNTIYNIYSLVNTTHIPISAGIHCYNSCDNTIVRNNEINNSECGILFYLSNTNITWEYNRLYNITREGLRIEAGTGEVYNFTVRHNTIDLTDIYESNTSAGIHIFGTNIINGIEIYNNSVSNYTLGYSFSFGNRIIAYNNTFQTQRNNGAKAVSLKTTNSTYDNFVINDFYKGIRVLPSENVTIRNTVFTNGVGYIIQFFQDVAGKIDSIVLFNITTDNTVTNNYEISANISNLSIQTRYHDFLIRKIVGFEGDVEYSDLPYPFSDSQEDYLILNNTISDQTLVYEVNDLTNTLCYYNNLSICGSSNINDNDGNINITLTPNNASYVLDNFNLTEGVSRVNSPMSLSSPVTTSLSEAKSLGSQTLTGLTTFADFWEIIILAVIITIIFGVLLAMPYFGSNKR